MFSARIGRDLNNTASLYSMWDVLYCQELSLGPICGPICPCLVDPSNDWSINEGSDDISADMRFEMKNWANWSLLLLQVSNLSMYSAALRISSMDSLVIPAPAKWADNMSKRTAMLALSSRNASQVKENVIHHFFSHFALSLDKLALLLKDLEKDVETRAEDCDRLGYSELEVEIKNLENLMEEYSNWCTVHMLMCFPILVRELKERSRSLKKALEVVVASHSLMQKASETLHMLEQSTPNLSAKAQTLSDSLDEGMLDSIIRDVVSCTRLAEQIAECMETSIESDTFSKEVTKLKSEKADAEISRGKAHGLYLDQCINLLEKAMNSNTRLPSGTPERSVTPPSRQLTMHDAPMLPLQSFICPITRDVMKDPVQIASGQTYERSAIEQWFAAGHSRCPVGGEELKNTQMKSNYALRQSIAEWRERNYITRIENAAKAISSEEKEMQLKAVKDLQALCQEEHMNKYKVCSMDLMSKLVHLAESKDVNLRKKSLAALITLAKDNCESQEIMVKDGVIDVLVRCLARRHEDVHQAVFLLRLLSERTSITDKISHAHGAIMFLVTLLGSEQEDTKRNVEAILANLPTSDDDVVTMAEANLFDPLVLRLLEGKAESKLLMAKTLSRLTLPVTSKSSIASSAVVTTLLEMVDGTNQEQKEYAVSSLQNLSVAGSIGKLIIQSGGLHILSKLLTMVSTHERMKVGVSYIIADAMPAYGNEWERTDENVYELEGYVYQFLQMMGDLIPADVRTQLLRALLAIVSEKQTSETTKEKLKDYEALNILLPLLKEEGEMRKNAMHLLSCLASSYAKETYSALKNRPEYLKLIIDMLIRNDRSESEQVAAAEILASVPLDETDIKELIVRAEVLSVLMKFIGSQNRAMEENVMGIILRLTVSGKGTQERLCEFGLMRSLIKLLNSSSSITRQRAARALGNLSKNSYDLSQKVKTSRWKLCLAPQQELCRLHMGLCEVSKSFCLVEADVVHLLVGQLDGDQDSAAALYALSTLIDTTHEGWKYGCQILEEAKTIPSVIKLVSNENLEIQELAINMLETIFRLKEFRERYGNMSQIHVIHAAQHGCNMVRQSAGRILSQLDLIQSLSNYFATR